MTARSFSADDQLRFAELTGDVNPMHMDAVAASRTQAGAAVVHGMHAVLWALDALQARGEALEAASALRVQFTRFIYLDRSLEVRESAPVRDERRFTIVCEGSTLVSLRLKLGARRDEDASPAVPGLPVPPNPANLRLADMDGQVGWLMPLSPGAAFTAAFPHLARAWGAQRVQALAALSSLVGMVCPGLYSLFSKLEVDLLGSTGADAGIGFASSVDERFRLVDLRVNGSGLAGKVSAFARLPPVEPKGIREIVPLLRPGEFEGMVALIVGGSRGLGATTAKIIAGGGGQVLITYAHAEAEAEAVARDIRELRRQDSCEVFRLDVFDVAARDLSRLGGRVTHLFYFATPPIFRQQYSVFSVETFEQFTQAYVIAFEAICASLAGSQGLGVFYPSSTAVEQRPRGMTEYSMAKAAGEILCAELAASDKRLHMKVLRLPRILTDQTATVTPVPSEDALAAMLPIVRSMAVEAPHAG